MNQADFDLVVKSTMLSIDALLTVKGGEYASSDDRLANFKRGAALTGCTPLQVLFIYLSKHYDAVASFVKTSAAGSVRASSEPIGGRFDDLINYCILAKALIAESQVEPHRDNNFDGCGLSPGPAYPFPAGDGVAASLTTSPPSCVDSYLHNSLLATGVLPPPPV